MAIQTINIGTEANDGTGDTWREAFDKTNDNFAEVQPLDSYLTEVAGVSVLAFDAVADAILLTDATMENGSAVLTSEAGLFTEDHEGKSIVVGVSQSASLRTTILSYQSATQVTLATVAPSGLTDTGAIFGTDNTDAFQDAFDAAATLGGYSTIVIPSGQFLVMGAVSTNFLNKNQNVRVTGAGASSRIFIGAGAALTSFSVSNLFKITWSDLAVIGCPETGVDAVAVFNSGSSNVWFERVIFYGLASNAGPSKGVIVCGDSSTVYIHGCDFITCVGSIGTGTGVIGAAANWYGIDVRHSRFIDLGAFDSEINFQKTDFATPNAWIQVSTAPYSSSTMSQPFITIEDNFFDEAASASVYIVPTGGRLIANIRARGNRTNSPSTIGGGVFQLCNSKIVTAEDNWFGYNVSNVNYAIVISDVGTAIIRNNICVNSSNKIYVGTAIGAVDYAEITNNTYTTLENAATAWTLENGGLITHSTYTVATLPAAPPANTMAWVSDASGPTYNATVSGSGAVKIPVMFDGTNWKCR